MGVGAHNDFGRHQTFARKMTKSIGFSVQFQMISKKKYKGLFTDIGTVFLSILRRSLKKKKKKGHLFISYSSAKLPEQYEIAQNFHAKLTKKYEIARNFDARSTP